MRDVCLVERIELDLVRLLSSSSSTSTSSNHVLPSPSAGGSDDIGILNTSPFKRRSRPRRSDSWLAASRGDSSAGTTTTSTTRQRSESTASSSSQATITQQHADNHNKGKARLPDLDPLASHSLTLAVPPPDSDHARQQRQRVPFWRSDSSQGLFPSFWLDTVDWDQYGLLQRVLVAVWDDQRHECVVEWDIDLDALVTGAADKHLNQSELVFVTATGERLLLPAAHHLDDNHDELEGDTGYSSDPGAHSSSRPRLKSKKSSRQSLSARRVASGPTKSAASTDNIVKLVQSERVLVETRQDLLRIRSRVDALLADLAYEREVSERKDKLEDLNAVRTVLTDELTEAREVLRQKRMALDRRKERLAQARDRLAIAQQQSQVEAEANERTAQALQQTRRDILTAQRVALTHLSFIYPIEPTDEPLVFSILRLALPNSSFEPSSASSSSSAAYQERIATALGHLASLVLLLSSYLSIPLPYTILYCGSRSVIQDHISDIKGTRSFPLWERGTEKWRMEYAVFLLNKDVEALVVAAEIKTTLVDLRATLPNVVALLLAYELPPSHSAFPASLRSSNVQVDSASTGRGRSETLTTRSSRASSNASTIRAPPACDTAHDDDEQIRSPSPVDGAAQVNGQNGDGEDAEHTMTDKKVVIDTTTTMAKKQTGNGAAQGTPTKKRRELMDIWAGKGSPVDGNKGAGAGANRQVT